MNTRQKAKGKQETLRKGSFTATLYHSRKNVSGRDYEIFRLVYTEPGAGRKVRDFGSREKAREVFEEVAKASALGRPDALSWSPQERAEFDAAVRALEGTGVGLYEAVQGFLSHRATLPKIRKTVPEVVEELISDRKAAGVSQYHLSDLSGRLGRFSKSFTVGIETLTPAMIEDYLAALKATDGAQQSARSRRNVLRLVGSLFHFARRRGYVGREAAEGVTSIRPPKVMPGETEIFTPDEMRRLLEAARPDLVPALAIGGFAGVRVEELQRLRWDSVRFAEGVIVVGAQGAKTASRRVIPILPNLGEWLAPHSGKTGKVSPSASGQGLSKMFGHAAHRAGIVWVPNGLRHSFVSYRLAVTHDVAKVAAEAGNSAGMVHRHYKALVSEADGKAWFDVRPAQAANIIPMHATA